MKQQLTEERKLDQMEYDRVQERARESKRKKIDKKAPTDAFKITSNVKMKRQNTTTNRWKQRGDPPSSEGSSSSSSDSEPEDNDRGRNRKGRERKKDRGEREKKSNDIPDTNDKATKKYIAILELHNSNAKVQVDYLAKKRI